MAQQTAVEWLEQEYNLKGKLIPVDFYQAKAIDKEQMGYSKEDVLKAGEIGEINHLDTKHIVSLLDEAREINNHAKNR